jgi:cyclic pyranopterin phosphate synthase
LYASEILQRLEAEFGPLRPLRVAADVSAVTESGQVALPLLSQVAAAPAEEYGFADGRGRIGLIASVSQPFCASCNRFRITADGKLRNCLFSLEETDIRPLLRGGGTDEEIASAMLSSVAAKREGHEINTARFLQPERPMYSIGG